MSACAASVDSSTFTHAKKIIILPKGGYIGTHRRPAHLESSFSLNSLSRHPSALRESDNSSNNIYFDIRHRHPSYQPIERRCLRAKTPEPRSTGMHEGW